MLSWVHVLSTYSIMLLSTKDMSNAACLGFGLGFRERNDDCGSVSCYVLATTQRLVCLRRSMMTAIQMLSLVI